VGVLTAVLTEVTAPPPPPPEPEPRAALERDLKQVRDLVGERIARGQRQYAAKALTNQKPSKGTSEPAWEAQQEAVCKQLLLIQQQTAEAGLRLEAAEQWDTRLAEASAAQLTAVIDIWEAAQRVHAEEEWRAKAEEEARRQRDQRLRVLEGAISSGPLSNNLSEAVHEPLKQPAPAAQPRESAWDREVARQREASAAAVAEDAALAMRVFARETLDAQAEAAVQEGYRQAIGSIVETFRKCPAVPLLDAPHELLFAPVRIAGHRYMGREHFKTYAPPVAGKLEGTCEFPPQTALLAKLKSQLYLEQNLPEAAQKRVFPPWTLTVVAITATVIVAFTLFGSKNEPAEARSMTDKPAVSSGKPAPASAAVSQTVASDSANPLTHDVEVSGLRIGVDVLHRSQLQYLVVNHSGVQLSGLMLHIKVTSSAPSNKGVLFQVSAVVPSLGPNESKEIRTDIEGQLQSKPIPDWRYLKTEVQVSTQ